MAEYDVLDTSEFTEIQKKAVKLVQERNTTSEIAEKIGLTRRTTYRLLKGLAGYEKDVPRKYHSETQYLRLLPDNEAWSQRLSTAFTVTPEGFLLIENISIEIEVEEREITLKECKLCGFDDNDCLHEHHIIPRSQGGSNDESNLIVLCANCHAKVHMLIVRENYHPQVALEKVAGDRISQLKEAMR